MWKLIILSTCLIVTQTADLSPFLGTWTQVAFYPVAEYLPTCIKFVVASNAECDCGDGKETTLADISMVMEIGNQSKKVASNDIPMLVVDALSEADINVDCTCGENNYTSRALVRLVNSNYFVLYHKTEESLYTDSEPNDVYVFAKEVEKEAELSDVLQSIEDLKDRKGAKMCASDINY